LLTPCQRTLEGVFQRKGDGHGQLNEDCASLCCGRGKGCRRFGGGGSVAAPPDTSAGDPTSVVVRGAATGTVCAVDAARALLCGRQAALVAEASSPDALVVEQFDYKNKDGVAAKFIGGCHKPLFNFKEYGVIAVDAAASI
jgi:hypothetical protein